MNDQNAMVGELEMKSIAKILGRSIHVQVEGSSFVSKYTEDDNTSMALLMVKYFPNEDAEHYEAMMPPTPITSRRPAPISTISPFSTLNAKKRKTAAASSFKSHVLTDSPYKCNLQRTAASTKTKGKPEKRSHR